MYFVLAYNDAKISIQCEHGTKLQNKFTIFIIHIFELRLVHENQISTLLRKFFT